MAVWWGTEVECHSAISRLHRMLIINQGQAESARELPAALKIYWEEIAPDDNVRLEAIRQIHRHPLKAADGLQLAAAMIWANHRPAGKYFVCLDDRLREVARIEGFLLVPETI